MPYITGQQYTLTVPTVPFNRFEYIFSPKHRGQVANDEISKWDVVHSNEAACFINSMENEYVSGSLGWGFIKNAGVFLLLGRVTIKMESHDLKVAKFTKDDNDLWHGYPCYLKRKNDKPPKQVLTKWVNDSSITKKQMSKISARQKCNL